MANVDNFQRQHRELAELAKDLASQLDAIALKADASHVRRGMATFLGKLKVHAAMEDGALYPTLLDHTDPTVRERARTLKHQLGPIYERFDRYARTWLTVDAIERDPERFVQETMDAFAMLRRRMIEEQAVLYPMVRSLSD